MKRRYILALMLAFVMVVLDLLAYPLTFGAGSNIIQLVFFGPFLLGERFLLFARWEWGWPIAPGFRTSLSEGWVLSLLCINLCVYAALGFVIGAKMGRVVWKES